MKQLFQSPIRVAATFVAFSALTACGFTPMHVTEGGQATFSNVAVKIADGKSEQDRAAGFRFAQHLKTRIDAPETARYTLQVEPSVSRYGLGLSDLDQATRYDRSFSVSWTLRETDGGKFVDRGRARGTTSFNADLDPYRLASNDDQSLQRVTRSVADILLADVALAIQEHTQKPAATVR